MKKKNSLIREQSQKILSLLSIKRDYKGQKHLDIGLVDDLIITDGEIKEAIKNKEIFLEPFSEDSLQPASYDMRLGDTAIISKTITIEKLQKQVENEEVKEINVKDKGTIIIPPGAFALLTTLEKIGLTKRYAGHIGMRSYYTRKGLVLLSGIQIDPGFEGHLVLGACNLSPRSLELSYADPICTIEILKLNKEASKAYSSDAMKQQKEGKIPRADKDYLRTIETMSISDLTTALTTLSRNVDALRKNIWYLWFPLIIAIIVSICTKFL
ncbi:MAG: dCTP deaminase [Euryarchaeota archaeon]|nr:dCTP deaminase [Euryarchaeota archaeon]